MRLKALSLLRVLALLSPAASYAACVSPAGKSYSGHLDDVLYYQNTAQTEMNGIWGKRYVMRWTFSGTGSTTASGTITMSGYSIAGGDGGSAVSVTSSNAAATWTYTSATCSGTITIAPKTSASSTNTYYLHYQLASGSTIINTVNKTTPTAIYTQTSGSTTTLIGGGTLWQE